MKRARDSAAIRMDALRLAAKKAAEGCDGCARSYFELAEQHGATQGEIEAVLSGLSTTSISRRLLLKLAAAGAASVALVGRSGEAQKAFAYSTYWGTDSNTQSCCGIAQNFYVGRLGYGTTVSSAYFNVSAATAAGPNQTYGYWGLEGPGLAPSGTTPYNWGKQQASAAANAWLNGPNYYYLEGITLFADVETGFGGWTNGNYGPNQQVLQGFLDGIATNNSLILTLGLYCSPSTWSSFFGTSYKPTRSYVLWVPGCQTCNGCGSCTISCAPCSTNCSTTKTQVQTALGTGPANVVLGGSKMVLWQYWISPPTGTSCLDCGDWDVAIQDPSAGFTPATSSTTYYATGC